MKFNFSRRQIKNNSSVVRSLIIRNKEQGHFSLLSQASVEGDPPGHPESQANAQ